MNYTKSQKGITLVSVVVYVIAMTVVIGIIATITIYFYSNVNTLETEYEYTNEISKFNMFFIKETQARKNEIVETANDGSYIIFSSGNKYIFAGDGIYRNHVKICNNVESVNFETESYLNGKAIITVTIKIKSETDTKIIDYALNTNM